MGDSSFFLAPNGNISPKDEFLATLKGVRGDRHDDVNSTQCRFPARTRWLKSNFPEIRECKYLNRQLQELGFKSIYIIFVSSYLNSPASSFGHTFLRFDRGEDTPLLSYVLNYSADINGSTDIFSYAYNGLFGGFNGKYGVYPYYEMVKIYSNLDSRDIWEYKLNFNRDEITRITLHMMEIQRYSSRYYFMSQNCSYNILWFIDLAREDLNLIDEFHYITVPMDTIKLLKRYKLIDGVKFRPSKRTKMEWLYSNIEAEDRAKKFLDEQNISIIEGLERGEQAKILDLAILRGEPKPETLKYRSRIDISKLEFNSTKVDPINSTLASKLTLSSSTLGGRVSYHDIYDVDYDFNEGKYISFLDFKLKWDGFESLDFIKIESLTPSSPLSSSISWGLSVGYDRGSGFRFEGSVGKSYRLFETLLFFKPSLGFENGVKFGYKTGAFRSVDKLKFGVVSEDGVEFKPFLTYQMGESLALHLYYFKHRGMLTLFYYF